MTSVGPTGVVEFRFYRPGAREVALAGDFGGGWGRAVAMEPDAHGWWVALVPFAPGEYRFRYRADGAWFTDFASHGVEPNEHGWDSVLYVPDRAAPANRHMDRALSLLVA